MLLPHSHAFGCIKNRFREEVILQQNLLGTRIRKAGFDHSKDFHNVTHAFAGMSTSAMKDVIKDLPDEVQLFFNQLGSSLGVVLLLRFLAALFGVPDHLGWAGNSFLTLSYLWLTLWILSRTFTWDAPLSWRTLRYKLR